MSSTEAEFQSKAIEFVNYLKDMMQSIADTAEVEEIEFVTVPIKKFDGVVSAIKIAKKAKLLNGFIEAKIHWTEIKSRNMDYFLEHFNEILNIKTLDLSAVLQPIRTLKDLKAGKYPDLDKEDWPVDDGDIDKLWNICDELIELAEK